MEAAGVGVSDGVAGTSAPLLCMECCAGRGRLSAAVQAAFGTRQHEQRALHHVLIDRCITRNSDKALSEAVTASGGTLHRVTADLADVSSRCILPCGDDTLPVHQFCDSPVDLTCYHASILHFRCGWNGSRL